MDDSVAVEAEEKRRRLAALLAARARAAAAPTAGPGERELSPGQARLMRLVRLDPEAALYNVAVAYALDGPLDAAALARAVARIAARHDILRTTFPQTAGGPVQRIAPAADPDADLAAALDPCWHVADLSDGDPATADAEAYRLVAAEAARAFDLAAAPPWRLTLIRLAPSRHRLVLAMHHMVTDGWSFEVFLGELRQLYAARRTGAADPLAPLPLQYADLADRQRAGLEGAGAEAQRRFWADRFADAVEPLRLPAAGGEPGAGRAAATVPLGPPEPVAEALAGLGRQAAASPFMVTLAAFAALLSRSTGQTGLLVCTPVVGRHRAQTREAIGYFNNILPIRLDLDGAATLGEVLARTRAAVLDAFRHQDVPFQWIAERPALRRVPLSRLLFSLDTPWPPVLALDGVEVAPLVVETGAADFDLSVSLWNEGAALRGTLRYKRALFDDAAAGALAEGFHAALAMLAADPATPVAALPPLAVADGDAPQATGPLLPRTPLELRLARLWEEIFDRRPVGVRDGLQALGASSIAVAALAERIQAEFRTDLPVTALFRAGTIERMAALLQSRDGALLDSPLAPIRARGSRPPLFLCEGVGVYYPLAGRLDPEQPVWGLVTELVGAYPGVEALATHYVAAIRAVQPHGPYRLGGLSFGGLVAFEMAQQLIAAGEGVELLVLFDTPGPGAYRPKTLPGRLLGHVRNVARYGAPYLASKFGRRFRRRAVIHTEGSEARRLVADQQRLRSLFHGAAARYTVRPYPGRITLFALESRDSLSDGLFDPALGWVDPMLGWGTVAQGGVDLHHFKGEHVSMLHEPHVAAVAVALEQCIANAATEDVIGMNSIALGISDPCDIIKKK